MSVPEPSFGVEDMDERDTYAAVMGIAVGVLWLHYRYDLSDGISNLPESGLWLVESFVAATAAGTIINISLKS